MHRVEMLEQLLAQAASRGLVIRQEWLGGRGGGLCEMRGQSYLFVDLALSVAEQLAQVAEALERHSVALPRQEGVVNGRPSKAA
jgi:hypothetical protein